VFWFYSQERKIRKPHMRAMRCIMLFQVTGFYELKARTMLYPKTSCFLWQKVLHIIFMATLKSLGSCIFLAGLTLS